MFLIRNILIRHPIYWSCVLSWKLVVVSEDEWKTRRPNGDRERGRRPKGGWIDDKWNCRVSQDGWVVEAWFCPLLRESGCRIIHLWSVTPDMKVRIWDELGYRFCSYGICTNQVFTYTNTLYSVQPCSKNI